MIFGDEEDESSTEVRISAQEKNNEDKSQLEEEAESKLVEDSSSSLPGVGGSGSSSSSLGSGSTGSAAIDVEDVHSQNEKIIGLLEDIKSEISEGGSDQLL